MSALDPTMVPAELPVGEESAPNRWSRWSDLLNPILVREVQQAIKGRVFMLTVVVALAISVVIAVAVAGDQDAGLQSGRSAFDAGLATLVPLLIFVVPMQAYQSMRMEMRAGIVEQLLLSELRPRRIVVGKLAAAMVQFVLYISVMSPLLATSYLLRGVDLPTIGLSLLFALVFCIAATSFAVSSAAQGALPAMQGLANLAVAVGLGMSSFGLVGFVLSGQCSRSLSWLMSSSEFGVATSLIVLGCAAGSVLSALIAQSFLAHGFENRSTPFRIYLLTFVLLAFGWIFTFVPGPIWDRFVIVVVTFLMLLGAVFGVFMVTEQRDLSPRVRAHVPTNPLLALLAIPVLPGRDRGLWCLLLYYALVAAFAIPLWPTVTTMGFGRYGQGTINMNVMIGCYTILYATMGRWLRARMPAGVAGNHMARVGVPLLLFLFCVLPLLLDAFVQGGVNGFHAGHVMNPFFAIGDQAFGAMGTSWATGLLLAAGIAIVLQLPVLLGGAREVLVAARERRARIVRAGPEAHGVA
ncbi:MAG: hypothetical protein IT456_05835 [Planctomycetes bacterium]|nr:hypothetical protein [Planctomycetota bacterium]